MKPIKLTSAVAALAFTAILGMSSARAQNAGDVILGFEEPGTGGSANVYEVDLGSITKFLNPSSSTLTFNLSTSDLSNGTSGFGSGWATNSLLQWGVIGGTQTTGNLTLGSTTLAPNTLFTSWNTWTAAPTEKTSNTQKTGQTLVTDLYNDTNPSPSPGSTVSLPAVYTSNTDPDGFAYLNKSKSNFNFGAGYATSDLDYNSDGSTSAPTSAVLDLYEVAQTSSGTAPGTLLGTFSLAGNGNLTYSPEAVPEPSSYALVGFGALVLVWNLRRRNHRGSTV